MITRKLLIMSCSQENSLKDRWVWSLIEAFIPHSHELTSAEWTLKADPPPPLLYSLKVV